MNIQRVAVNATMFCYRSPVSNPKNFPDFPDHISGIERFRSKFLQREIRPLVVRFPALRQISIVIEEVNPFAKGDLVFFKIGPACLPVCEMCIKAASCAEPGTLLLIRLSSLHKLWLKCLWLSRTPTTYRKGNLLALATPDNLLDCRRIEKLLTQLYNPFFSGFPTLS